MQAFLLGQSSSKVAEAYCSFNCAVQAFCTVFVSVRVYLMLRSVALGVILRVISIIVEANASLDCEELNKKWRKKCFTICIIQSQSPLGM